SKRYESALETLSAAQRAGVISDKDRARTLQLLEAQMLVTGRASTVAAGGLGRFSGNIVNAGFQVQDFAVQVAAGQSAMTAFAQQFPQLMGVMGFGGKLALWGAGIGTLAAVLMAVLPAIGLFGGAAKKAEEALDDLSGAVSRYREYTELANQ